MDKLRVGVIVDYDLRPQDGGTFSYEHAMLNGLNQYEFHRDIEIVNIIFHNKSADYDLKKPCLHIQHKHFFRLKKLLKRDHVESRPAVYMKENGLLRYFYKRLKARRNKGIETFLSNNNIDLVYYLTPERNVLDYPFIATHWDVGHRSTYSFPEAFENGINKTTEDYYVNVLNKAFLIFCESQTGARELHQYYSIFKNKIKVVPIFGGNIINLQVAEDTQLQTLAKHGLIKNKYFLYPAQFWTHKNHYNLILAFNDLLRDTGDSELKLVLSGTDKGNMAYIRQLVDSLNLHNAVLFPGFVAAESLYSFYTNALALVMPTFVGPTNMPLIEAANLKCAVICSDLEGHREIMGNNALFIDPLDKGSIEEAMERVLRDEFRENLSSRAHQHIKVSEFNIVNSLQALNKALVEAIPLRKTWGIPLIQALITIRSFDHLLF